MKTKIKTRRVYEADDGATFDTRQEAILHECETKVCNRPEREESESLAYWLRIYRSEVEFLYRAIDAVERMKKRESEK